MRWVIVRSSPIRAGRRCAISSIERSSTGRDFRPFAPSVLAEHADEWFEVGAHSASHEFMLFAPEVKPERRDLIPAVVHKDGTARVQLVSRKSNPRFHELISLLLCANRRAARRQYLLQRQRADRLHAHRRDRHVSQVRY